MNNPRQASPGASDHNNNYGMSVPTSVAQPQPQPQPRTHLITTSVPALPQARPDESTHFQPPPPHTSYPTGPIAEEPELGIEPAQVVVMLCQQQLVVLTKVKSNRDTNPSSSSSFTSPLTLESESGKSWWYITHVENDQLSILLGQLVALDRRKPYHKAVEFQLEPSPSSSNPDIDSTSPDLRTDRGRSTGPLLTQHFQEQSNHHHHHHYTLRGIQSDTPHFAERVWLILIKLGLQIGLATPSEHPLQTHLSIVINSDENQHLHEAGSAEQPLLLQKGLEHLVAVETYLACKMQEHERLNSQVRYLRGLSPADYELYRVCRAGRNRALVRLIKEGMGLFCDKLSQRLWLDVLDNEIPIWEMAAQRLRDTSSFNNNILA